MLYVLVRHRDVKLVLEGVDKYGNLFGTVLYNAPAAAPAAGETPAAPQQEHLAEQLLRAGLAKVGKVEGNAALTMLTGQEVLLCFSRRDCFGASTQAAYPVQIRQIPFQGWETRDGADCERAFQAGHGAGRSGCSFYLLIFFVLQCVGHAWLSWSDGLRTKRLTRGGGCGQRKEART